MTQEENKIDSLAQEVLRISRNNLIINLRFMDRAISMLELEGIHNFDKCTVDGKTIYYNPTFILKCFSNDKKQAVRLYLHMILHCVYHHFWISTQVNQDYWNLACDIAVENSINDMNLDIVRTDAEEEQKKEIAYLKTKVKYITADLLYKYFIKIHLKQNEYHRLNKIFASDNHMAWYVHDLKQGKNGSQSNGKQQNKNQNQQSDSNQKKESEENASQQSDVDVLRELKKIVKKWQDISRQMKMDLETFSKRQRSQAGSLEQNLMAVTREKYDYTEFLKKFSVMGERMKINDDEFDYIFYTYGLSRYKNMPLIEPLEYKDVKHVKEFVIAIDTSGSTSNSLVQKFLTKTYNILKNEESFASRFNLHIIQCDAEIQEDVKICTQEDFDHYIETMKIRGLGGTDFRPVFSYVDELMKNKEFVNLKGLIYFTDGYGTFPVRQPAYHTAFVYIDDGYNNLSVPPWAIKLILQPDEI